MSKEEKQELEEYVEVEEEHKWTFQNYFRSIGKFKWWIIGASVVGAVAGYLGFRLILNPAKKVLDAEYTLELAGKEDESGTIRFIDGSQFNTYDLTSRKNLQAVVDSNEAYKKINVDKLIEKQAITITKNVKYYNDNDASTAQTTYTIRAKSSQFPSDKIGKQFVYDLINYPKTISTEAIKNFKADIVITSIFDNLTFDGQIDQLNNQYNSNLNVYTNLGYTFSTSAIASDDGKQLKELQSEYEEGYKTNGAQTFIEELRGTLDSKFYISFNESDVEKTILEIKALCEADIKTIETNKKDLEYKEAELAGLQSGSMVNMTDSQLANRVVELSDDIYRLKTSILNIGRELNRYGYFADGAGKYVRDPAETTSGLGKLEHIGDNAEWVAECKSFKTKINDYKVKLEADRETASDVYKYCYTNYQNRVNVLNGGYVSLSGGISNMIGAAAGLVGGFVLSSLVCACIYICKKEDEKK